jgi:hypothetical protein
VSSVQRSTILELAIVCAAFLAMTLAFAKFQKQISFNGGKGWEGVGYYTLAEQFASGAPLATEGPYVYRLATPWLAAKIAPHDLFRGFKIVNVTANAVGVLMLWFWLRRHIGSASVRVLLVVLYLIQWDAPTRWIWFYPAHTDPWLYVTLFGGLLLVDHYRANPTKKLWIALCALSVVGVLNREVAMLVPLALLFAGNPVQPAMGIALPRWRDAVPMALGLATFAVLKLSVQQTDSYSFVGTVIDFLYGKGIGSYVHAWCLAFGPVLFLVLYDWRSAGKFLWGRQDMLAYFAACAIFGYIGGTDTERLLYWSVPVTYVLLGRAMESHRPALSWVPLVLILATGQILSARLLFTTPDYDPNRPVPAHTFPVLTPFGSNVPFLDLFSYHGFRVKEAISLAQFAVFGAGVLAMMRRRERVEK